MAIVFGVEDLPLLLQVVMLSSAGILLLLGGIGYEFGSIKWYQLIGAGDILLGLSLCVQFLGTFTNSVPSNEDLLFMGMAAIGGLSLAYIGVDWIRGGKHFDLSQFDSSAP